MVLKNLQALRGVAAGIVFIIHWLSTKHELGADWFLYKFWWVGPAGVDLFFVISGFIICLTAARSGLKEGPSGKTAFNFAAKRFFRIFPVYWLVLACAFVVAGRVELSPPDMPHMPTWRIVTLMTTDNDKVMLAWTLAYELFFYGVLTLILWKFPKKVFQAVGIWTLLSASLVAIAAAKGIFYFRYLPMSPLILEFCAGCVVAYLVHRGAKQAGWTCLLSGTAMFALMCWVHSQMGNWEPWYRAPIFILPCALVVYGAVAIELTSGWTLPHWLQRLGDASYSLYIWHQIVLAILLKIFQKFGLFNYIHNYVVLFIWAACAILVGFISYHFIERPIQNWAGRVFSSKPAK